MELDWRLTWIEKVIIVVVYHVVITKQVPYTMNEVHIHMLSTNATTDGQQLNVSKIYYTTK